SAGPDRKHAGPAPAAVDEMHDTAAELWQWPLLAPALEHARDVLIPPFDGADGLAETLQERHRLFTSIAATCGTGAVLFAIAQLTAIPLFGKPPDWLMNLEALGAAAALVAVAL